MIRRFALAATLLPPVGGLAADPAALPGAQAIWIAPAGAETTPPPVPALLSLPPGWSAGDAAVLLLVEDAAPPAAIRLRDALLDEQAATLELAAHRLPRTGCDARLQPWIRAAGSALRWEVGSGILVVVGFGCTGQAALAAAADQAAPRFALGVALADRQARFAEGERPARSEAWETRAPILCELLAEIEPATAPSVAIGCTAWLAASLALRTAR